MSSAFAACCDCRFGRPHACAGPRCRRARWPIASLRTHLHDVYASQRPQAPDGSDAVQLASEELTRV